jgi:hypothetical protein
MGSKKARRHTIKTGFDPIHCPVKVGVMNFMGK